MAAAGTQTTERMTRADTSFFILTALFLKKHSSRTLEYASSYFFKSRLVKIKKSSVLGEIYSSENPKPPSQKRKILRSR